MCGRRALKLGDTQTQHNNHPLGFGRRSMMECELVGWGLSCLPEGTHELAIEPVGVIVKIADVVWWWRTLVSLRQHQYISRCS